MDSDCSPVEPFAKRVGYFRRLFARGIGRTPSALLKHALDKAAFCAADAERARSDVSMPCCDRVAIFREARLAERALAQAKAGLTPANKPQTLGDLLRADIEEQRAAKAVSA
jgi:hypothetical protein